jgi:hypothetical protein
MNGFKKVCIVKGAAFFNDKIDGELIDSGSVFIEEALDESKGRAKGVRTVEYRCPDHQLAARLITGELPAEFEVSFVIVTSKRGQVITVEDARPAPSIRQPVQPMPKAA